MPQLTIRPLAAPFALVMGGLLLLSGGCTDKREITAPSPPGEALRNTAPPPLAVEVASSFIQAPPTNGGGGKVAGRLLFRAPAPMWIRVRTEGSTSYAFTEEAKAFNCDRDYNCMPPDGPSGYGGGAGPRAGSSSLLGTLKHNAAELTWPHVLGTEPNGQREWLVLLSPGDSLVGGFSGIPGVRACYSWWCNPAGSVPAYALKGGVGFRVEHVTPIRVTASTERIGLGEAIAFTADTIEGVRALRWRYFDGLWEEPLHACDNLTVCQHTPRRTGVGAMIVNGNWRGRRDLVNFKSSPVTTTPPALRLTCGGQRGSVNVKRFEDMYCSALPTSGTASEHRWTFVDTAGNTFTHADKDFWEGFMIVGGEMKVTAKVGGTTQRDSMRIAVAPSLVVSYPSAPPPPTRDVNGAELGEIVSTQSIHTLGWYERDVTYRFRRGDGPNDGWWATERFAWINLRILINNSLYPDHPFYRAQTGIGGHCGPTGMEQIVAHVEAHERNHHRIAFNFWSGEGGRQLASAAYFNPAIPETEDSAQLRPVRKALLDGLFAQDSALQADSVDIPDRKKGLPCTPLYIK